MPLLPYLPLFGTCAINLNLEENVPCNWTLSTNINSIELAMKRIIENEMAKEDEFV